MKIRILIILVLLLLLAMALASGFVLLWRLLFLSVAVLLVSYVWAFLSMRGIEGQVKKSAEHLQVGDLFSEAVTVSNKSNTGKLLVEVQENTDFPGYSNMVALNLTPRSSHSWQTNLNCRRRGRYTLGSLTATAGDPLGFFPRSRQLGEPQNVTICPATLELPFFQPLSRSELGYDPSRWLVSETGPSASRVREYINGDNLNHIHWSSTAHSGTLMVKEFDPDRSDNAYKKVWIVADMHGPSQLGEGDEGTEEYCVVLAASLIKKYIDAEKDVGLIASADQNYLFEPKTGEEHLWNMLEALAVIKADGQTPIENIISSETERFGAESAVIVITPSASEGLVSPLRNLKRLGAMVAVILLDPISFGGKASLVNMANGLVFGGLPVHIYRRGDELTRQFDSRSLVVPAR